MARSADLVDRVSVRHDPAVVTAMLADVGLRVTVQVLRAPEAAHETTPQAFLVAVSDGALRRDGDG